MFTLTTDGLDRRLHLLTQISFRIIVLQGLKTVKARVSQKKVHMMQLFSDQSQLTDQVRYEVQKPYNCRKPHPQPCDVSREQFFCLCSSSPGDNWSKVGGFYENREHKAKTVGDVDQQMVQRGILHSSNGVPERNVSTQTCQSCGGSASMTFLPHELVQVPSYRQCYYISTYTCQ